MMLNNEIQKVSIIGAGSWGTTIAKVIAQNNPHIQVMIWAFERNVANTINELHENKQYLPGIPLPDNVTGTGSLKDAVHNSEIVLLAPPSKVIFEISQKISRYINKAQCIAFLSKGFCKVDNSILTISQTITRAVPKFNNKIVAILGPSHAEEVSRECHTCLTVACPEVTPRKLIVDLLSSSYLQCRECNDIIGVEIGGTLKNPAAIAAGMISVMPKCGDNLEGALISEAVKEMISLGKIFNTKTDTILDISGLGDLVATALSDHSRNRRFGKDIANQIINKEQRIKFFDKLRLRIKPSLVIQRMSEKFNYLAEGAYAIEPLIELANKHNISIPVYRSLYEVLLNRKEPTLLIETIKNPNKFYELYKKINYQISDRKKGLEKVKGNIFKDIISKRVTEKYNLTNDTGKESNVDINFELVIENLRQENRNQPRSDQWENRKNIKTEYAIIGSIERKNYNKCITRLTKLYINKLIDNHNPYVRKFFVKLMNLYKFTNLFSKRRGQIHITGTIPSLDKIGSSSNIIYLPRYTSLYDFLFICITLPRIKMPFPRFFVDSKAVNSKMESIIIKMVGGYIVNTDKLTNIIYREVLKQYITIMIEYGVPILYIPHTSVNRTGSDNENFLRLLNDIFLKNPVEIVLLPIEISYNTCFYKKSGLKHSYRNFLRNDTIINFSETIYLSQHTKDENAFNLLNEKLDTAWNNDGRYFPHILFAKILVENNYNLSIPQIKTILGNHNTPLLKNYTPDQFVSEAARFLIKFNYITINKQDIIIKNKKGINDLANMIND